MGSFNFSDVTLQNDKAMSIKLTQAWVDFASTGWMIQSQLFVQFWFVSGDPTPPGSGLEPWGAVTSDGHQYLLMDTESRMEMSQEFSDRVSFWRDIMAERTLPWAEWKH